MNTLKIKRYRLGVSRNFPKTHPRKGDNTNFEVNILLALQGHNNSKIHTIRSNYPFWEKRMAEVHTGRAVIELFYWSGKPYNSPQVVFATLDKDSGCGVQELGFYFKWGEKTSIDKPFIMPEDAYIPPVIPLEDLSKNDGLSLEDFKAWFKNYDLSKPMVIIQFTKFRY